jgi:hypothetical protein
MKRIVQIVLAVGVIALGFWLWTVFFPSPEKAIRSRLNQLAKTVSFESGGGMLGKAYSAEKVGEFFTVDAEIEASVSTYQTISLHGRADISQTMMAVRSHLSSLKVEFPDMNITLGADKQTATVNLTGRADVPGEQEISAQEFNFMLKKVDGKWLIYRVETVKTLSQIKVPGAKCQVSSRIAYVSAET